ncbi:MAG: hypothetical protein VX938_11410, partial [Myxococcota bacterium]|nr:hypothetical protein [Myxococcota bacterium]
MRRLVLLTLLLALVSCDGESSSDGSRFQRPEVEPVIGGGVEASPTGPGGISEPAATEPQADSSEPTDPGSRTPADVPTAAPDVTVGMVGDACDSVVDCNGASAVCLSLPGGYCAVEECADGGNACPDGSQCFAFQDGTSYCIETCTTSGECRQSEGYVCDQDGTCWPGPDAPATGGGTSPVGGPCETDSDCADPGSFCYPNMLNGSPTGFVNGYCLIDQCTADS